MVALGGWGRHRGRGKGPRGIFLWIHLGSLSSLGTERWRRVWLGFTCRQTATPPVHCPRRRGQSRLWPLGSDLPWFLGKRQRNRLCVTPELADQASQGATAWGLGGQAKTGSHSFPRQKPRKNRVSRWWGELRLEPTQATSAGRGSWDL